MQFSRGKEESQGGNQKKEDSFERVAIERCRQEWRSGIVKGWEIVPSIILEQASLVVGDDHGANHHYLVPCSDHVSVLGPSREIKSACLDRANISQITTHSRVIFSFS